MSANFNEWFVSRVTTQNYEDRIVALENQVNMLKAVIENLYIDTDVDVTDRDNCEITVNSDICIRTISNQDFYTFGTKLSSHIAMCTVCSNIYNSDDEYCPQCGEL